MTIHGSLSVDLHQFQCVGSHHDPTSRLDGSIAVNNILLKATAVSVIVDKNGIQRAEDPEFSHFFMSLTLIHDPGGRFMTIEAYGRQYAVFLAPSEHRMHDDDLDDDEPGTLVNYRD